MTDLPDEARERFTAAEAALYPLAMSDTEGYQRATTLVGLVVGELRRAAPDLDAVLDSRDTLLAALPALAAGANLTLRGLTATTVVDAASALRCRELMTERADAELLARIATARDAGQAWFTIEEPDAAGMMAGVFRQVELHIASGTVLISELSAGSGGAGAAPVGPTYTVEVVRGHAGGSEPAGTPPTASVQRFQDREQWQAAQVRCRAEVEGVS